MQAVDLEKLDLLAPPGAFSTFDMEVLVPLVQAIPKKGVYLEVGVDKGKSLYIARVASKPSVEVYGVDLGPDPGVKGTIFLQGDGGTMAWNKPIDVLFIDGDHSYTGCKADIDNFAPHVKDGGVIAFHDADEGGPGVLQAITEYVNNRSVQSWKIHKTMGKNTSMVSIQL